jgi:hypothetical protein
MEPLRRAFERARYGDFDPRPTPMSFHNAANITNGNQHSNH